MARKIERGTIISEVRQGSARDAILHAVGSNAAHGLRRTQADKRRAVERLLKDPEWSCWSDRKIADVARVDHKTVAAVRRELSEEFLTPAKAKGGEFPTPASATKAKGGEFPTANGKPNGRDSLVGDLLRTISDGALIAECRRRGLKVEVGDDV